MALNTLDAWPSVLEPKGASGRANLDASLSATARFRSLMKLSVVSRSSSPSFSSSLSPPGAAAAEAMELPASCALPSTFSDGSSEVFRDWRLRLVAMVCDDTVRILTDSNPASVATCAINEALTNDRLSSNIVKIIIMMSTPRSRPRKNSHAPQHVTVNMAIVNNHENFVHGVNATIHF